MTKLPTLEQLRDELAKQNEQLAEVKAFVENMPAHARIDESFVAAFDEVCELPASVYSRPLDLCGIRA